jgi:peptide deformylase
MLDDFAVGRAELRLVDRRHPALKAACVPLPITPEYLDRACALGMIMTNLCVVHQGLGLSAPQVGVRWRVVVVKTASGFITAINPTWTPEGQGKTAAVEGCLSDPGLRLFVSRYRSIRVVYTDVCGHTVTIYCRDLAARVWQHEIDHLDGVCIWDK